LSVLARRPRSPGALTLRARIRLRQGSATEALADADTALSIEADDYAALLVRAKALYELGRRADAVEAATRAAARLPKDPNAHMLEANYRELNGDLDGAIECLKKVLELRPGYVEGMVRLSGLRLRKGDADEAIRDALAAVTAGRNEPAAWLQLGYAYKAKGAKERAIEALEKAITLLPESDARRVVAEKVIREMKK
jgi:tetratricopeptide (TPR) repeat protein